MRIFSKPLSRCICFSFLAWLLTLLLKKPFALCQGDVSPRAPAERAVCGVLQHFWGCRKSTRFPREVRILYVLALCECTWFVRQVSEALFVAAFSCGSFSLNHVRFLSEGMSSPLISLEVGAHDDDQAAEKCEQREHYAAESQYVLVGRKEHRGDKQDHNVAGYPCGNLF